MTKRRPYIGPSEANANALYQRERTYSAASDASFSVKWDWHRREPKDLREAVRMVRAAYADEVPRNIHEGPDHIDAGGVPAMTGAFLNYIDSPGATDAVRGERPLVSHYLTPFRAALSLLENGSPEERRRASIVRHVTVGAQSPAEAARAERAHPYDAKLVAEQAIRSFLRQMSDLRIDANMDAA